MPVVLSQVGRERRGDMRCGRSPFCKRDSRSTGLSWLLVAVRAIIGWYRVVVAAAARIWARIVDDEYARTGPARLGC